MREIKFRAWHKNRKTFLYFYWAVDKFGRTFSILDNHVYDEFTNEVELMQYTGLNDVNGVEIYEGDIVNVSWPLSKLKGRNHAIGYSEVKDGHPVSEAIDWYEDVSRLLQTHDNGGQITVVGNCFENPELLEAD
ncbi:YopX family protein [Latilactobacillus curvatus]|uniref:YopX family protein n=1 Tax=Latilactobacillus curvatus TaxID=28038 RepID=UPI002D769DF0|nr:YopX family protein [Latilactobacillus curvatus]WRS47043.1 YopX family protein [Latilactobacillus curvatus]